jgi:hypothetical protein
MSPGSENMLSPAESMNRKTGPVSDSRRAWWRILPRVGILVLMAAGIGTVLNHLGASLERSARPAGFGRGVIQGALMPMALPNLAVGKDVTIYSPNNTGVPYKLGYTAGVNACGAIFFGFLFWRVQRLRRWARRGGKPLARTGAAN